MNKLALALVLLTLTSCAGAGSVKDSSSTTNEKSGDWINITEGYFTPDSTPVGSTASLYVYIESVSDCRNIKWLFWETDRGVHKKLPVNGNACAPPEWYAVIADEEVTGKPGQRWITLWFTMADGTESDHLTVHYTVAE